MKLITIAQAAKVYPSVAHYTVKSLVKRADLKPSASTPYGSGWLHLYDRKALLALISDHLESLKPELAPAPPPAPVKPDTPVAVSSKQLTEVTAGIAVVIEDTDALAKRTAAQADLILRAIQALATDTTAKLAHMQKQLDTLFAPVTNR